MKNLKRKLSIGAALAFGLLITSCNTTIDIAKKRHSNGYYVSVSNGKNVEVTSSKTVEAKTIKLENKIAKAVEASLVAKEELTNDIIVSAKEEVIKDIIKTVSSQTTISNENTIATNVASKKQLSQEAKTFAQVAAKQPADDGVYKLLLIILAIILPPVAVLLVKGIGGHFLISILLTLLFWLPGIIHALLVVFGVV